MSTVVVLRDVRRRVLFAEIEGVFESTFVTGW
jgi:hypothetical protein